MTALPDLGWLMSPMGIVVFAALYGLIMSGLVGRIVLYVENMLTQFDLGDIPASVAASERPAVQRQES